MDIHLVVAVNAPLHSRFLNVLLFSNLYVRVGIIFPSFLVQRSYYGPDFEYGSLQARARPARLECRDSNHQVPLFNPDRDA